jgi:DNA topoisomerase-1
MKLVIVESPAKAKTINKYLGKDFDVLASFGHIRDLPSKNGSVLPERDFEMIYEIDKDSLKHVSAIEKSAKRADAVFLATDPDREGEAISWHVVEALKERGALNPAVPVKRVVFHEITAGAVRHAVANPRDLNMDLVNSQQARRALDYLVGFTLSPVLWRKLPGSRSAGRVQSVALRLICEREEEIEKFKTREYWSIHGVFLPGKEERSIRAKLWEYHGEKVEQFSFTDEASAKAAQQVLEAGEYAVSDRRTKRVQRHPKPPFTTSTLQQEAARKLGFSAKKTMQVAQKLYEGAEVGGEGLITYMRTDAVTISKEAVAEARDTIGKLFGASYVPAAPRSYKNTTKNAQEAHEAVRPTSPSRTPESLQSLLGKDFLALYDLIWKRTVASQMESAELDQTSVTITDQTGRHAFRASGSVIVFDGFFRLYREGTDDEKDEEEALLPPVATGDRLGLKEISPEQHFTQPPPRYSEASLVKKLEELGIGRPSTYASIISVLQDRSYVRLDKRRFIAEERGRLVTCFLCAYFPRYVEYDFTAKLEEELDDVAGGSRNWKGLLHDFWQAFESVVKTTGEVKTAAIIEELNDRLAYHLFPQDEHGNPVRSCPECKEGTLSLKVGKFGAFLGCSRYPECNHTKQIGHQEGDGSAEGGGEGGANEAHYPQVLGTDPASGLLIQLKKGPYGVYLQLGDDQKDKKKDPAPKRLSLPKGVTPESVTPEAALSLLRLPRSVGSHPETGKEITAGIGRFGPYVKHDGRFVSVKGDDDVLTLSLGRAVDILASQGKSAAAGTVLGAHPGTGKDILLIAGRYGPYMKYDGKNVAIPKDMHEEPLTLEQAVAIVDEAPPAAEKKGKRPAKKKAAAKKK